VNTEPAVFTPEQASFLVRQRVARLATASGCGEPHVIPVCFAFDGRLIYIALDEKPKNVPVKRLKRVRNILENPHIAFIVDRFSEDWDLLAYVMVRGWAGLVEPGTGEQVTAIQLLRGKYHQYERMSIKENPVLSIRPDRIASWGALETPENVEPLMGALLGRRSVRRYLDREVPEKAVEGVLEAARWAPSPHGRQPWRFAVITREKTKKWLADAMGEEWRTNLEMDGQSTEVVDKRLEGSRQRLLNAPVLVMICLYLEELDVYPDAERRHSETTMAVQSLGAAVQNMLLAAYSLGLDASWMCAPLFCPEKVTAALSLDLNLIPHALLTLGYAAGDPPKRRSRKPLDELVVYQD
jgi:coenzyme F420-0:L-glutamate ligase/coenzyme F420-1:gamma-L-glutamate ligase